MSIVTSLVKGFVWGLGLALAAAVVAIGFDSFYVTKQDRDIAKMIKGWDLNRGQPESLTSEELAQISVEVTEVGVVAGQIVVAGKIRNTSARGIRDVGVGLSIYKETLPITRCQGRLDEAAAPESEQTFSAFCRGNWNYLADEELSAKAKLNGAWR